MKKIIPAVRGMHDILPADAPTWSRLEALVAEVMAVYGYQQLRTPVLEREELFLRPVGEHSDIVQKELFRTVGTDGDVLCLRPEGTVPTVRALAQGDLVRGKKSRTWYMGPMFRHERPQHGRLRQFHQFGAEVMGIDGPEADLEMLLLCWRMWHRLGVTAKLELQVNNLGFPEERQSFRQSLQEYFADHAKELTSLDQGRITTNPLRILDSKDEKAMELIKAAPRLREFLGTKSRLHCDIVMQGLAEFGIPFIENPLLVRGLDYYNLTVFEWVEVGSTRRQNTIAGGGRYDGLLQKIGGQPYPGTGMAAGMERIINVLDKTDTPAGPDIFLALEASVYDGQELLTVAEQLRDAGFSVLSHAQKDKISTLFKYAKASKAQYAAIIGSREKADNTVTIKPLQKDAGQFSMSRTDLGQSLRTTLDEHTKDD